MTLSERILGVVLGSAVVATVGLAQVEQPSLPLPGLYLTDDIAIAEVGENHLAVASIRPCGDLGDMLAAGQWRLADRLSYGSLGAEELSMLTGFGGAAGDLLQRGDRLAFVALDGGENCSATIAAAPRDEIVLEGDGLPGATAGWTAATRCYRSASSGDLTVSVYFDTDAKVGGLGQIVLERSGDGYTVASDDPSSVSLNLLAHGDRFLAAISAAYAGGAAPALLELEAGESLTATVTVGGDAEEPAGRIDLDGLVDVETYETNVRMSLPFACPGVIETS